MSPQISWFFKKPPFSFLSDYWNGYVLVTIRWTKQKIRSDKPVGLTSLWGSVPGLWRSFKRCLAVTDQNELPLSCQELLLTSRKVRLRALLLISVICQVGSSKVSMRCWIVSISNVIAQLQQLFSDKRQSIFFLIFLKHMSPLTSCRVNSRLVKVVEKVSGSDGQNKLPSAAKSCCSPSEKDIWEWCWSDIVLFLFLIWSLESLC